MRFTVDYVGHFAETGVAEIAGVRVVEFTDGTGTSTKDGVEMVSSGSAVIECEDDQAEYVQDELDENNAVDNYEPV